MVEQCGSVPHGSILCFVMLCMSAVSLTHFFQCRQFEGHLIAAVCADA